MKSKICFISFLSAGFMSLTSVIFSDPIDYSEATLSCMLDSGETVMIFAKKQEVYIHTPIYKKIEKLTQSSFQVYRCPLCYGFTGKAFGSFYKGYTSSQFNETTYKFSPSLKLEGHREVPCLDSEQGF
jgi:hypothetical protein